MAAARRCGETGPTSRECRFLAAILPFDDVLRLRDVNNDVTRVRARARSAESVVNRGGCTGCSKLTGEGCVLQLAARRWECFCVGE